MGFKLARIAPIAALVVLTLVALPASARPKHVTVESAKINLSALPAGREAMAAVVIDVAEGFHAQSHTPLDPNYIKFAVKPAPSDQVTFGPPQYPPGQVENYPALGKLSVYTGRVVFYLPLKIKGDAKVGPTRIAGTLHYQTCDASACYPPENVKFSIDAQIVAADATVSPNDPALFKGAAASTQPPPGKASSTPSDSAPPVRIAGSDGAPRSTLIAFCLAFLVGIIFNVMPCVLPVLPLKAIGFYEVSQHNRGKSVALGLVFSLGLVATFAVFGLLIFVFHAFDWGGLFTQSWFIGAIVIILLAMAAATFGVFTVAVPTGLYNISPRHDTYLGNFEFGILTALLSTPCTFGMFVGLLAWAIAQPAIVGVLMLVIVGAGMASPYLVLSAMPEVARRFPRAGPWAELVKQMMGFLLLLAAVYFARPFIGRVIHGDAFWWAPFAVVVIAAVYLIGRTIQYSHSTGPRIAGVIIALLMVGASLYAVLQLSATPFVWQPFSTARLDSARKDGKIVLVEFTADWCGNCQYVEAHVLHSKPVVASVRKHDVLMLKADVTRNDAAARPLLEKLNPAGSIPLTVIYSPNVAGPIELTGIYSRDDLDRAIARAARVRVTSVADGE